MRTRLNGVRVPSAQAALGGAAIVAAWAVMVCAGGGAAGDAATVVTPQSPTDKLLAAVEVPDVIALRFHHDLCPFCKQLDPQFQEVAREASDDSVLFLTLDMTTNVGQRQAGLLVGALGIKDVWTGDYSRLGTVTLVDGRSRRILSSIRPDGTLATTLRETIASVRAER